MTEKAQGPNLPQHVPACDGVHGETRKRDAGYVMAAHHCHGCHELFFVQTGRCRYLVNEHIHDLQAGDFILIPPMVLHYTRYVFGSCTRTVLLFRREDVDEAVAERLPHGKQFFDTLRIFKVPPPHLEGIEACLQQIAAEERIDDPFSQLIRKSLLQYLLLACGRVCDFLPETLNDIQTTDPQLVRAARYIRENYMQPLTTEEVARAVGFSPNYLSRKFRTSAGIGLHEYLVFVRLHHAALELVATEDSITTIALRCGFSDSNYFKDSFKKKYGVTPRAYRKMM